MPTPRTMVDNLVVADCYLDEAFAYDGELSASDRRLLVVAQVNIQAVIDHINRETS